MARRFWYVAAAFLVAVEAATSAAAGSSKHVDRHAVGNRDADWCRPADRKALEIYRADGIAILKNFLDRRTLVAVQRELERVVDTCVKCGQLAACKTLANFFDCPIANSSFKAASLSVKLEPELKNSHSMLITPLGSWTRPSP